MDSGNHRHPHKATTWGFNPMERLLHHKIRATAEPVQKVTFRQAKVPSGHANACNRFVRAANLWVSWNWDHTIVFCRKILCFGIVAGSYVHFGWEVHVFYVLSTILGDCPACLGVLAANHYCTFRKANVSWKLVSGGFMIEIRKRVGSNWFHEPTW